MTRYTKHVHRPIFDGKEHARREHLGKLLRDAREDAGFIQAAVAPLLGYKNQSHISQIENANRTLDPIELETFAHLYGKTLNDFATWRDDQPTTEELQRKAKEFARVGVATSKSKPEHKKSAEEIAAYDKLLRINQAKAFKKSGEKSEP